MSMHDCNDGHEHSPLPIGDWCGDGQCRTCWKDSATDTYWGDHNRKVQT